MFGLTFANPAFLHALWAALIPILVHLLNRRRTVTVSFSNVRMLQDLHQDRMRTIKIKQVLLLLLRTLTIILLVLAFANPSLRSSASSSGRGSTSAVLLLDRSLSMRMQRGVATRFEAARARLREVLDLFEALDEAVLVFVDDRVEVVEAENVDRISARLSGVGPTFRSTRILPAIEDGMRRLGQSEAANRELFLFSDMAAHGWSSFPDSLAMPSGVSVFLVTVEDSVEENVGILGAYSTDALLDEGSPATLTIRLKNYGTRPKGEFPMEVFVGGRKIAQQIVQLGPGESKAHYVRYLNEGSGMIPLRVEISRDALLEDNVRESILVVPERIRILLVGEAPGETYYLRQALMAASDSRDVLKVDEVHPTEITADRLSTADVIVLCNVSRLRQASLRALRDRVEGAAGLMICLGDRVDLRYYNQRLLPAFVASSLVGVAGKPGANGSFFRFRTPPPVHTIYEGIRESGAFDKPRFSAYLRTRLAASTEPILSFRSGAAALAESRSGEGRVLLFTSSFKADLSWTDLSMRGLFVPLIHRVVRYLAEGSFGKANYQVGEVVSRELRGVGPREALVRPPSGETRTIWPEQRGARTVWPVGETEIPGIWEIYAGGRWVDRFAVRIAPEEGDPTPIGEERLARIFRGGTLRRIGGSDSLPEVVMQARLGREIWRPLLGLALGMMVLELLIIRSARASRETVEPLKGGGAPG